MFFSLLNSVLVCSGVFPLYKLGKIILKNNYYVSTSIVSTNLTKRIAKEYGINYYETLTGFKNICSASNNVEEEFLFGFEESFRISIWKSCKR